MNGLLGIQREADRQAMNRDAMNVRGGMLREDPSLMQRVGGTIADYAVPDRYVKAFNPSVMSPRLESDPNLSMQDMPDMSPMLMDMMPGAGIIKQGSKAIQKGSFKLDKRKDIVGSKGIKHPDKYLKHKDAEERLNDLVQFGQHGLLDGRSQNWYKESGQGIADVVHPSRFNFAVDNISGVSPRNAVNSNTNDGLSMLGQHALGYNEPIAKEFGYMQNPIQNFGKLWSGQTDNIHDIYGQGTYKAPNFSTNIKHGYVLGGGDESLMKGLPDNFRDLITADTIQARAGGDFISGGIAGPKFLFHQKLAQLASEELGVIPHELQAMAWTDLRSRWNAVERGFMNEQKALQKKSPGKSMLKKGFKKDLKGELKPALVPKSPFKYYNELFSRAKALPTGSYDVDPKNFSHFLKDRAFQLTDDPLARSSQYIDPATGRSKIADAVGIPSYPVTNGSIVGVGSLLPKSKGAGMSPIYKSLLGEFDSVMDVLHDKPGAMGRLQENPNAYDKFINVQLGRPLKSPY